MSKKAVAFSSLALITLAAIFSSFVRADSSGRTLYNEGKYAEALTAFKSEISARPKDGYLYYDLGNTYYRLGQYGMAVAYFEKANRLRPHDADIQSNLALARANLVSQIGSERVDPSSSPIEQIADNASLDEIRAILGLFAFVLTLFWIRTYLKTRRLRRTIFRPTGILGIFALVITSTIYGAQRLADSHPPAIAIAAEIVRSGPGGEFAELSRLEPGIKVRTLGPVESGGGVEWRQIRYSQNDVGWVPSSSLLLL